MAFGNSQRENTKEGNKLKGKRGAQKERKRGKGGGTRERGMKKQKEKEGKEDQNTEMETMYMQPQHSCDIHLVLHCNVCWNKSFLIMLFINTYLNVCASYTALVLLNTFTMNSRLAKV